MKEPKILFIPVIIALLASCGMSKGALERGVASRFQQFLDTDDNLSGYGMKVETVTLVKSGSYSYNGYVTVDLDGESHDVGITVTVDGSDFMFETTPFAFGFLVEKAVGDLLDLESLDLESLFDW
ncbi:MAG: hypothetical protein LBK74_08150 [Treponema sp.]|jgi:hypothetical protein|nr:hypothetical protein [Treponema sp.]